MNGASNKPASSIDRATGQLDLLLKLARRPLCLMALLLAGACGAAEGDESGDATVSNPVCAQDAFQECVCPDSTASIQVCRDNASGWEACECDAAPEQTSAAGEWCEGELCWQDPPNQKGLQWQGAIDYCEGLSLAENDDWRLPTIDELRSTVAGCPELEKGGACGLTDGTHGWDDDGDACINSCSPLLPEEDLGLTDCFWREELHGACGRLDSVGTPVEFWSSTPNVDDEEWAAFIFFQTGSLGFNHKVSYGDVRCVRDAD